MENKLFVPLTTFFQDWISGNRELKILSVSFSGQTADENILDELNHLNGVREKKRPDISSILELLKISKKHDYDELYYFVPRIDPEKIGFIRVTIYKLQRVLQFYEVPPNCPQEVFLDSVEMTFRSTSRKRK